MKFYLEDRLRSFARMITSNYKLKVIFTGSVASITTDRMFIPPLENTPEAFSAAKFLVAHESGHELHSVMDLKENVAKRSLLLADVLNSLEDARVERLMTDHFEGLHALFEEEIHRIIAQNDYSRIPLSVQALHGLYMVGKGYDTAPICKEARKLISGLGKLITDAVSAKDTHELLKSAEVIYGKLKHLEDEHKETRPDDATGNGPYQGNNLPDMVIDSLDEHKLPPDYDNMEDYPFLKDENVDEEETETVPSKHPLPEYLKLVRHHTAHQCYLIQHLRSIIETKRRRSRKKSVQNMQCSGIVDVKRLWKLATGDDRVMKQRLNRGFSDEIDPDSLAVYILLDESHSMDTSGRMRYSKEAVAVLGEVLCDLDIPFAITGYSTSPGLCRYLYKRFDEDYMQVRTRLADATHRSGTYTQEHISYAVRRLAETGKRKKVLVVVTDAEEVESPVRFRRAVEMTRDANVEMLGLGINTNAVQAYFDRFVELSNLQGFSEELLKLLRTVLAR